MYLRLKVGRMAGEVRDVCPEAARAMLADGRAVSPGDEMEVETETETAAGVEAKGSGARVRRGVRR